MSPVFFIDRALGLRFADVLEGAGLSIERHRDHFGPDAPDVVWIAEVAARGWYALSQDDRIYRNPVERAAVMQAGLATSCSPAGGSRLASSRPTS